MGLFQTDKGHPGWLVRLLIGMVGSAVPLAGPFIVKFSVYVNPSPLVSSAAHIGSIVVMATVGLAWFLSVIVTTLTLEDHVIKIVLGSMGIPGIVVSGAVGLQALN